MNDSSAAPHQPFWRRALAHPIAFLVLVVVGWLLLHVVIHIAILVATVVVVAVAIAAGLWALNRLF